MDPMDFVLHQHHPRPAGHYDPVHAASGAWIPHPQSSPTYQWQPHPSGLPQPYPHPLQQIPGDPFFFAQNGGLPPPVSGFHGAPALDSFPGMSSRRFAHGSHRQTWRSYSRPAVPPFGGHPGSSNYDNEGSFVNQTPGNRPMSFQAAANPGAAAQPSPAPSDSNSPSHLHFTTTADTARLFVSSHENRSHFPSPAPPSNSFTNNPPSQRPVSTSSTRHVSVDAPAPTGLSVSPGPRRTPRARRNASMSARSIPSETGRAAYHELQELIAIRNHGLAGQTMNQIEDEIRRQVRILRSSMPLQKGTSKATIQSLLRVKIEDLPEDERCCSICYNDFGVESPEKYTETPVQLPKCKHVFGDHCIKQWLAESHFCPYCRDELVSVASQPVAATARAFVSSLRAQAFQDHRHPSAFLSPMWRSDEMEPGERNGSAGENAMESRTAASQAGEGQSQENHQDETMEEVDWQEYMQQATDASMRRAANGRRSPPIDSDGQERRTRPRRDRSASQASGLPSLSVHSHANVGYDRPTNSVQGSAPDPTPRVIMPPMPQAQVWMHTSAPRPEHMMAADPPAHLAPVVVPGGWGQSINMRDFGRVDQPPSRGQILPNPLQTPRFALDRRNRENIPPVRPAVHLPQTSSQTHNGSTNSTTLREYNRSLFDSGE